MSPVLLTLEKASQFLGLSAEQVETLTERKILRPPVQIEGETRWRKQDLKQWVDQGCTDVPYPFENVLTVCDTSFTVRLESCDDELTPEAVDRLAAFLYACEGPREFCTGPNLWIVKASTEFPVEAGLRVLSFVTDTANLECSPEGAQYGCYREELAKLRPDLVEGDPLEGWPIRQAVQAA